MLDLVAMLNQLENAQTSDVLHTKKRREAGCSDSQLLAWPARVQTMKVTLASTPFYRDPNNHCDSKQ